PSGRAWMEERLDVHTLAGGAQDHHRLGAHEAGQQGETVCQEITKAVRVGRAYLHDPVELAAHRMRLFNLVDVADHPIDRLERLRRLGYANHEEGRQGHTERLCVNPRVNPL